MKILILNRDYPRFLADLYASRPGLAEASYADQLAARNDSLFGCADFYSRGFIAGGHVAQEIHVNNRWLQSAWARENGFPASRPAAPSVVSQTETRRPYALFPRIKGIARRLLLPVARRFFARQLSDEEERILAAQIETMAPDVILNQEMSYVRASRLRRLAPKRTKIVGQIASALPVGENYALYDLIVSSLPNFVRHFRERGARSELSRLAFEPRVLDRVGSPERDIDVSFVGSLSADHAGRVRLIEALAERVPLLVWGNGVEELPRSSPIRTCYRGEAWGASMYEVLARSRITINHHIDLAAGYSNNMRLYEATGCGALMVVDRGRNLGELFDLKSEVVPYSSIQECIESVLYLLSKETARAEIAAAGQRRTLREHTYAERTAELSRLLLAL